MAGLRLSIDPSGVRAGASVMERALADIRRQAGLAEDAVDDLGETGGSAIGGLGNIAKEAAKGIAGLVASYATLATAAAAVDRAFSLNAALAETATLISHLPGEIDRVAASAANLADEYGGSDEDQVRAFYQAISGGAGDAANATELLHAANMLASGGVSDVTTAVGVLTTATNVYAASGLTAAEASDAMFVAMRAGVTTIPELSAAIGAVIPLAEKMGLTFDELLAATSALTLGGLTTATAVTGLRAVMSAVLGPSEAAKELAKSLGLEFNSAALEAQGFAGFMESVVAATGGSAEQMQLLFGSVEAVSAALALSGSAGEAMNRILGDMINKAGATQEAFDTIEASWAAQYGDALDSMANSLARLADEALPAITVAAQTAADVLNLLIDNADIFGIGLGVLAASYIPAAVGGLVTLSVWLATAEGLFIAGAVAAKGMAIAMNLIPFVAVVSVITGVTRGFNDSAEAATEYAAALDSLSSAHDVLEATTTAFYETMTAANLASMQSAAQAARDATAATLDAARAELEAASFFTNFFGASVFETERMASARAAIAQLEVALFDAEARLSAADHAAGNFATTVANAETVTNDAAAAITSITTAAYDAVPSLQELRFEYGSLAEVVRDVMVANNDLAQADADRNFRSTLDAVSALSVSLQDAGHWTGALSLALLDARAAGGFEEQAKAALDLANEVANAAGGAEYLQGEARAVYDSLLDAARAASDLAVATGSINFGSAIGGSAAVAENMRLAFAYASSLAEVQANASPVGSTGLSFGLPGIGTAPSEGLSFGNLNTPPVRPATNASTFRRSPVGSGGGSGGSGGSGGTSEAEQEAQRLGDALDRALSDARTPLQEYNDGLAELAELAGYAASQGVDFAEAQAHALAELNEGLADSIPMLNDVTDAFGDWVSRGLQDFEGFATSVLRSFQGLLSDMIAESLRNQIIVRFGATTGGQAGGLGGIFGSLFAGLFDAGGVIPNGQFGIVGERGPEVVTSTGTGTHVTSRANTARMMGGSQQVEVVVTGGNLTLSDGGAVQANINVAARQASSAAVGTVKQSWAGWANQYQQDGVLA